MKQAIAHTVLMAGAALLLAGCGFADSHAPLPDFMRARANEPPSEPPPDVKQMVRSHLDSVFVASSAARDVRVSRPHHQIEGLGWTACVRAELNSATGKPLGTQIYRITIEDGVMLDRRHVEADDNCVSESYEPI
jgi:hypothetical protein